METSDDTVLRPFPDRRRGPRRLAEISEVPVERRGGDRRRRKPGVAALMGAVLSPSAIGLVVTADEHADGAPAGEAESRG